MTFQLTNYKSSSVLPGKCCLMAWFGFCSDEVFWLNKLSCWTFQLTKPSKFSWNQDWITRSLDRYGKHCIHISGGEFSYWRCEDHEIILWPVANVIRSWAYCTCLVNPTTCFTDLVTIICTFLTSPCSPYGHISLQLTHLWGQRSIPSHAITQGVSFLLAEESEGSDGEEIGATVIMLARWKVAHLIYRCSSMTSFDLFTFVVCCAPHIIHCAQLAFLLCTILSAGANDL